MVEQVTEFDANTRFLVVGDIHGCFDELMQMLVTAKYNAATDILVSVGDLCDRGPQSKDVLTFFANMFGLGKALVCRGNHDDKLMRYLNGRDVKMHPELLGTLDSLAEGDQEEVIASRLMVAQFLNALPLTVETEHFIAVHGAYRDDVSQGKFQSLALYGETNGEKDEEGYPIRLTQWMEDYKGTKDVLHGHVVVNNAPKVFKTKQGAEILSLDGGCVHGGHLIGVSYPDKTVYKVKAAKVYCEKRGRTE